jgi:hypothetical protein
MSSSELEDTRGQGKGDSRNDGDDPAEDFEDAADSEAADDAQQTLNEIEAEVEESGEGDTASASTGDVAADTTGSGTDTGDSSSPEPGRNGLASNQEVLDNAFDHAESRTDARDAGISEGNTTADSMEILELEDGSRVFATDADDAYPTMLAETDEAIDNNLRSPKVIEALGGNACKSALVEDADGTRYIAREGIEGDLLADIDRGDMDDATASSATDTMAAAYFVGNRDLHTANMMVDSDGNVTIIDHDSAGEGPSGTTIDMDGFTKHNRAGADSQEVKHKIYDTAHQIKSGEQDLPVAEGTSHHEYAHKTAEKAVRRSYVDQSYSAPSGNKPSELQSSPDGYDSPGDFNNGDSVRFVNSKGEIVSGSVKSASDRSVRIDATVGNDSIRAREDDLTRIVEVN